eukprot:TRINITY_DN2486_c0_g1_i1.p1 TRINITY_DN2486_c0_g1~~TRINITY_DN2486_c0_g1_i1.p1  ORF type:complete len:212 (-),score=59.43 TRINITY_DN2486_c0_g1_i1:231-866(-)
MKKRSTFSSVFFFLFFILIFIFVENGGIFRVAEGKKRVHVTDELDDVIDDEEDDAWKEWGKKSSAKEFDPPPTDFSGMQPLEIQAELMKRQLGPSFGFVKLRLGVRRSKEVVPEIAMKWTKVLKTGAVEAKFMAVDVNTIMFTMERGQDTEELKDFVLNQPEAYEIKIGEQVYRRPGDPPLEEVIEKLREKKGKVDEVNSEEEPKHPKEEL